MLASGQSAFLVALGWGASASLHAGAGERPMSPAVTVNDVLDDSAGGGTRLYDAEGENRVAEGPGTRFDDRATSTPETPRTVGPTAE